VSIRLSIRPSVRLSVTSFDRSSGVRRVCFAAERRVAEDIDRQRRAPAATAPQHGAQQ